MQEWLPRFSVSKRSTVQIWSWTGNFDTVIQAACHRFNIYARNCVSRRYVGKMVRPIYSEHGFY